MLFFESAAIAFGFVLSDVPGATPKKPASGLMARSRPASSISTRTLDGALPFEGNGEQFEPEPETQLHGTQRAEKDDFEPFECISSAEFDRSTYETQYHIENFLPVGEPCVLAAPLKDFQSQHAAEIASLSDQWAKVRSEAAAAQAAWANLR
jgi:hypothetical protein